MVQSTAQTWTQVGADITGNSPNDLSGSSVSLSAEGHRAAIGAPTYGIVADSGSVRVFEEIGGTWTQVGMPIGGHGLNDIASYSVSLSADGTRLAIGAPSDMIGSGPGYAQVFAESDGVWTQVGADLVDEAIDDRFGCSVALSADGTRLAVGAKWNDGSDANAGHVRIYEEAGGIWSQVGSDIEGMDSTDHLGEYISLSANGGRVAVGAPMNSEGALYAGLVQVFGESGGVWNQVGSHIHGEAAQDFSEVVSLSADGGRVAIEAHGNDDNGMFSGHVRVFEEGGGTWAQIGADIPGETAWDESGLSVSLSADGTVLAIGAPVNGTSDHVRLFRASGGTGHNWAMTSMVMRTTSIPVIQYRFRTAAIALPLGILSTGKGHPFMRAMRRSMS